MKIEIYDCRQRYPGQWKEIEVPVDYHEAVIKYCHNILKKEEWVYDCDFQYDQEFAFVIKVNGKKEFIKFSHEYYWMDWENPEERYVDNQFYYSWESKIDKPFPSENRDWIKV